MAWQRIKDGRRHENNNGGMVSRDMGGEQAWQPLRSGISIMARNDRLWRICVRRHVSNQADVRRRSGMVAEKAEMLSRNAPRMLAHHRFRASPLRNHLFSASAARAQTSLAAAQ